MFALFSLIITAFSSIVFGVVATIVTMAILYFLLKLLDQWIVRTPQFYITGVFLFILLFIQFSLLSGARKASDYMDDQQEQLEEVLISAQRFVDNTQDHLVSLNDVLEEDFPLVAVFVPETVLQDVEVSDFIDRVGDFLDGYVIRRIMWIVGLVLFASIIVTLLGTRSAAVGSSSADIDQSIQF